MAITTLPPDEKELTLTLVPDIARPVTTKPRIQTPAKRGAKVFLRILPDLAVTPGQKTSSRGFILIMGAIVVGTLLSLLALNTMMTSDAFILERLKLQTNIANDQRDAILKLAETKASPEQLAEAATNLGMIPAEKILYLDVQSLPDISPTLGTVK